MFLNKISKFLKYYSTTTNTSITSHIPVLCEKAISFFNPNSKLIIDMTFGAGGHTKRILEKCKNCKIIALDRDPISYVIAKELSEKQSNQIIPMIGKFSDLPKLLKQHDIKLGDIDGILFDFGCSSMQFDEAERGFSISKNGPLDMRMNNTDSETVTAAEVLSKIEENDLARILRIYGEEKLAKKIARAIIETRSAAYKIETTKQLADVVVSCVSDTHRLDKLQRPAHIATKTFQALRIFVNNELNEINYGMILAQKLLKLNGIMVTITFHSLEDTIVKRHINGNVLEGLASHIPLKYSSHNYCHDEDLVQKLVTSNWKQLHKHVITPDDNELNENARSRSAKLRAATKIS